MPHGGIAGADRTIQGKPAAVRRRFCLESALDREVPGAPVAGERVDRSDLGQPGRRRREEPGFMGTSGPDLRAGTAVPGRIVAGATLRSDREPLSGGAAHMPAVTDRSRPVVRAAGAAEGQPQERDEQERDSASVVHGWSEGGRPARRALESSCRQVTSAAVSEPARAGSRSPRAWRARTSARNEAGRSRESRTRDMRACRARARRGPRAHLHARRAACRWP